METFELIELYFNSKKDKKYFSKKCNFWNK